MCSCIGPGFWWHYTNQLWSPPVFVAGLEYSRIPLTVLDRAAARVWPLPRVQVSGRTGEPNRPLAAGGRGVRRSATASRREHYGASRRVHW